MRNTRTFAQFFFLLFVRPIFPCIQWVGRITGIAKEAKTVEGPHRRQPYRIGYIQDAVDKKKIATHLTLNGFFIERMAYPDPGQILSMRRLDTIHPDQQYHIRVFSDGEVRGHLEYTPEDRPLAHMEEKLFVERNDLFRVWIGPLLRK